MVPLSTTVLQLFDLAPFDLIDGKVDFGATTLLFGMNYGARLTKLSGHIALNEPETSALGRLVGLHQTQISPLEISSQHSSWFYNGEPPTGVVALLF